MYHFFLLTPVYGTCAKGHMSWRRSQLSWRLQQTTKMDKEQKDNAQPLMDLNHRMQESKSCAFPLGERAVLHTREGCTTFCLRPIFIYIPHRSCINCLHPSVAPKAIRAVHISGKDLHPTWCWYCTMRPQESNPETHRLELFPHNIFRPSTLASDYSATEILALS